MWVTRMNARAHFSHVPTFSLGSKFKLRIVLVMSVGSNWQKSHDIWTTYYSCVSQYILPTLWNRKWRNRAYSNLKIMKRLIQILQRRLVTIFTNVIKRQSSPKIRLWRPRGQVEVHLYSFFNHGTRWEWVLNATPRPHYPREQINVISD
jgi:hypothetical protein